MTTTTINEMFGYEETREGKIKFFKTIALWQLEDWMTQPLKDYGQEMSEDEMVDFVTNRLEDAYHAECDYRHEETDQECLYDIDHLVFFRIKNTPHNVAELSCELNNWVYSYEVDEEDNSISVGIINEWDSWILSRECYSEKMIESFCEYYDISEDDVLDKCVSING